MDVDVAICRDASATLEFGDLKFDGVKTQGDTISTAKLRELAVRNGAMCPFTNVLGSFNSTKVPKRNVLSFNRIINTTDQVRHNHYEDNLEVMLLVCNLALGPAAKEELYDWIGALKAVYIPANQYSCPITSMTHVRNSAIREHFMVFAKSQELLL